MIADVPSSSSIKTRRWINHVFLSFRGQDTRKSFTDHLYAALERRGCIKTFKDDHDLERGEVISEGLIKGIQESMFALVVLSPNYASSRWCLDELQNILESREKFGQTVFPIFYGVEPSDVRHQRGTFGEAFRKHEERFKKEEGKVQRWRDALKEVANYSGWDSKDNHEAALIETIVDHIQKLLIPTLPSWVGNLIGIESRMEKLNSLIGMQLDDVRFIGIWGMGGIGKTTIARLIYESLEEQFNFSCFLANIREVSATNGIVHIQRELLSHPCVRSSYFHNLFDGVKIIANSFRNKKVLLVLDDISERSQFENLAGKQEWFGPGSRIIITTRDKHLLATHGVHQTCELEGLVQEEALHLFCLKAFKQGQPKSGYQNLCREVVEYTKGLPLALGVLGSHLYGRTPEVWHSALKQISSSPHPEIQNSLKLSFDSLHSTEKELFLDIACFFKGMDKDEVIEVLENCGYFPQIGIEILIEKSLVTLGWDNSKLEMHDLLQEMGKNIVFQEYPTDPGKRSRLWSHDDISRVLTKNKGTEAIQGIVIDYAEPYEARWSSEAFSKTSNLRLLMIRNVRLSHGLDCLPYALRVLDWPGCPLKTLPLTDQLDVVDIKLSCSKIEQLWHGTKILDKLKSINLSFSDNLNHTPDFAKVPNLEMLVLEGCTSLTTIHSSVMCHKKLAHLNLKGCKSLKALPGKMEMSSLKVLNLSGCSKMNTAPEFGNCMRHLAELHLDGTAVTELPSSLGSLVGLVRLHLENCMYLVCLPDTIHKLKSLKVLNVSGCSKLSSLPECLQEMQYLEELNASNTAIEELPLFLCYLGNLKVMSFAGCKGPTSELNCFRGSPAVCRPSLLISLDLSYCNLPVESIPDGFCGLSLLRDLDLSGNNFVNLPSDISKHPTVEYLSLNSCKKLQFLPELPLRIKEISAINCASLITSTFHPSSKCSIFSSPVQWHLPREQKSLLKELYFPMTPVLMLITANEIPSWFAPEKPSSVIPVKHIYFDSALLAECHGYAECVLLERDADVPWTRVENFCCSRDIHDRHISRNFLLLEPKQPHLYILFMPRPFNLTGHTFVDWRCSCTSFRIVRTGRRRVYKEDLQDIYGNHSHTSS